MTVTEALTIQRDEARELAELRAKGEALAAALGSSIELLWANICPHENRHRGGVIWEICGDCGSEWADDRGGFKPNPGIAKLELSMAALAAWRVS